MNHMKRPKPNRALVRISILVSVSSSLRMVYVGLTQNTYIFIVTTQHVTPAGSMMTLIHRQYYND